MSSDSGQNSEHNNDEPPNAEYLNLKVINVQDGTEIRFRLKKTAKLKEVMDAYCARIGEEAGSIKLLFDGDRISLNSTPNDLGMEDEDEIDAFFDNTMSIDYKSSEESTESNDSFGNHTSYSTEEEEEEEEEEESSDYPSCDTSKSSYIEDLRSMTSDTPESSDDTDHDESSDDIEIDLFGNRMDIDRIMFDDFNAKHPMNEDDIDGDDEDINDEYIDIDDLDNDNDDDDNYNYCNDLNCFKFETVTQSMDKMVDELGEINKWIQILNGINQLDQERKRLINKNISIELVNYSNLELRKNNGCKYDDFVNDDCIEIGDLSFINYPELSGVHSNEELRFKMYDNRGTDIPIIYVLDSINEKQENLAMESDQVDSDEIDSDYDESNYFPLYREFDEMDISICQCLSYYKYAEFENYKYVQYIQQNMRNNASNKKRIVNDSQLIAKLIEMLEIENIKLQIDVLDILRYVSYKSPQSILMQNEFKTISRLIGLIKNESSPHIVRKSLYIISKISADNSSFRDMMLDNNILDGMIEIVSTHPSISIMEQIEMTLSAICSNYLSQIFDKSFIDRQYIANILILCSFMINESGFSDEIQKVFMYLRDLNDNNKIFDGDIIFNATQFVKQYNDTQNNLLFTGFARESIQNTSVPIDVYQTYLDYNHVFNIEIKKSMFDSLREQWFDGDEGAIEEIGKCLFVEKNDINTIIKCVKFVDENHDDIDDDHDDIFMNEKAINKYIQFIDWNNAELQKLATSILLRSGKFSNQELAFKQEYKYYDNKDGNNVFENKSFNIYPYIPSIHVFIQQIGYETMYPLPSPKKAAITDEIDPFCEEIEFQHRPVRAWRFDKEQQKWRGRGKGQLTVYYNKQKGFGKIIFYDEKHDKTRLLQYIDGQKHCQYIADDNKEEIKWNGADYTMDQIEPMICEYKVQFIEDQQHSAQFMDTFNGYIDAVNAYRTNDGSNNNTNSSQSNNNKVVHVISPSFQQTTNQQQHSFGVNQHQLNQNETAFQTMMTVQHVPHIQHTQHTQHRKNDSIKLLSEEGDLVYDEFCKTMTRDLVQVISIQKIKDNASRRIVYNALLTEKKEELKNKNVKNIQRGLFHGTSFANIAKIFNNGINRDIYFYRHDLYGKGIYFSSLASQSAKYCQNDDQDDDEKYIMLFCKVIIGEFIKGRHDMDGSNIPYKSDKKTQYESLVNNIASPTIFVINRDYHAIPTHIITFKYKK